MTKSPTQPSRQATQTETRAEDSTSSVKSQRPRQRPSASARRERPGPPAAPVLRFAPLAWAKLLFFRDRGHTEIGGFAVTPVDDLLYVEDFVTVRQTASAASVSFSDDAVADLFDRQVDAGRKPEQFARIWLHSHPGESPTPSSIDEETFARVFGQCDWAVLFVIGATGKTHVRLRFNAGPGGDVLIHAEVDFRSPFPASDHAAWDSEFARNIHRERGVFASQFDDDRMADGFDPPGESLEADLCIDEVTLAELADMDAVEREYVLSVMGFEAAGWQPGSEVLL